LILGQKPIKLKYVNIPKATMAVRQSALRSKIKVKLNNLRGLLPKKLRHPELLFLGKANYSCDFEEGIESGWTGGKVIYTDRGYVLKAIPKANKRYLTLELWRVFSIRKDTRLKFSYFYENSEPLIVQFWSKTYKRNFYKRISNPVRGRWTEFHYDLEDISPELIDSEINSIHIATLNKQGAILIIDDVLLN
jgi:hypothetical protein